MLPKDFVVHHHETDISTLVEASYPGRARWQRAREA